MRLYILYLPAFVAIVGLTPDRDAALVISEIMSRPSGGSSTEWFELYNSSGKNVNLTAIRFDDAGNASAGTTLSGTLLTCKYAIITAQSSAAWTARYGALPSGASIVTVSKSRWDFGNCSDRLTLYNTVTASNFFFADLWGIDDWSIITVHLHIQLLRLPICLYGRSMAKRNDLTRREFWQLPQRRAEQSPSCSRASSLGDDRSLRTEPDHCGATATSCPAGDTGELSFDESLACGRLP